MRTHLWAISWQVVTQLMRIDRSLRICRPLVIVMVYSPGNEGSCIFRRLLRRAASTTAAYWALGTFGRV